MDTLKSRVYNLLSAWCDRLLTHQITESVSPHLDGALLCPACGRIHGRCGDLVFPLTVLYAETGNCKYLEAAIKLVDWSENNLVCEDGTYRNDVTSSWRGITAFSAMALGETLLRYRNLLPAHTANHWQKIFERLVASTERLYENPHFNPNVNYYAGVCALFALVWHMTGEPLYLNLAEKWEQICLSHFDDQGLFTGEGGSLDDVSPKGCRGIDTGYNLEESLPLLILYAVYAKKEDKRRFYAAKFLRQMEFLLPDGGIDNSFGSRHYKWTYWGSRTSDGMQEGLVHITDLDPVFAKAALKNFELYERCTADGDFYPSPMSRGAGQPACIHHAFTHAKALAFMYLEMNPEDFSQAETVLLPREKSHGVKAFQKGYLQTVSVGGWLATVNASDFICYKGAENTGGSLTFLWHRAYGPVCAATMHNFNLIEPNNMQLLQGNTKIRCMTPRIICGNLESDCSHTVSLEARGNGRESFVLAKGAEPFPFEIRYSFTAESLTIRILCDLDGVYELPVIAAGSDSVRIQGNSCIFRERLTVSADNGLIPLCDITKRFYNPVGGFQYYPLQIPVKAGDPAEITLCL